MADDTEHTRAFTPVRRHVAFQATLRRFNNERGNLTGLGSLQLQIEK